MNDRAFLLFCLGRTGSTSLMGALNKHPGIRCILEPFNSDGPQGSQYRSRVKDETTLQSVMTEFHGRYNGVKHVWDPHGWPFQEHPGLNPFLASLPDYRVVFLFRKNLLRRIVSSLMSIQHNLWQANRPDDHLRMRSFVFQPLDIDEVQYCLELEQEAIAQYAEIAARRRPDTMLLWYEDLFPEQDEAGEASIHTISGVIKFLGFDPPGPLTKLRMRRYLRRNSRMNSSETYSQIPNIEEVERRCGSNQTGWLFREAGSKPYACGMPCTRNGDQANGSFFLLYCVARSGSTTLAEALNVHPDIRCCLEPFNQAHYGGRYLKSARDQESLADCLRHIRLRHNGMKHVWGPKGWPFLNNPVLNRYLAEKPDQKLVLLRRRNVLRRLVSAQISEQLRVWYFPGPEIRDTMMSFSFRPLDMDRIRRELEDERIVIDRYAELAKTDRSNVMHISYEDLFPESDQSGKTALTTISRVIEFLGYPALDQAILDDMLPYVTCARRLNSVETYYRIPDIQEIEESCGSDATGWLFQENSTRLDTRRFSQ